MKVNPVSGIERSSRSGIVSPCNRHNKVSALNLSFKRFLGWGFSFYKCCWHHNGVFEAYAGLYVHVVRKNHAAEPGSCLDNHVVPENRLAYFCSWRDNAA